ncbi:MAG: DUF11 domain-containing protein, partial [Methanobrevibacter sp.]|nr:DUF11 domain-containing protein [Methanobrevibacter sp.]
LTPGAVVSVGDLITYIITVSNFGPDNATDVVVTDVLDSRLVFISATGNYDNNTGLWTIGNLNVGNTVSLNITVRVNGSGNIPNVANVFVNETNIGNNSTDGNDSNFTVNATVNLTISKTSNATEFMNVGDLVEYTIIVTNHGPDNATGVLVTDILDFRLVFVNATGNYNFNGTHVIWSVGNLNVANNVTLTLIVRINGTGNITNNASVTADQENIGNNSTDENGTNFTVNTTVNLTITKTNNVSGAVVRVGDLITYTITVSNFGPDNATGVVVTDVLDSRLVFVSATGNYDNNTGLWTIGNLNVGSTVSLNITAIVNGSGNIPNVANVSVNETNIGNNSTEGNGTNFTVNATVNLTITKVSNATEFMNVGDLVEYTIVVTNHGPDNATGVVVTDVLDPRLVFVSATGNYNFNGTHVIWDVGNLIVANNITLTLIVRINGTGNITNNASVTADQDNVGNNSTDGNGTTNFTVNATVNLTITKTNNVSGVVVRVGDLVTYTIIVSNFGPDNATGVVVTDVLDSRLVFVSTTGNYDYNTGLWTIGNLNVGSTVSLNITVRVNGSGNILNVANVSVNETNIGNNSTDGNGTNFTVNDTVNLTITKVHNATGVNVTIGDLVEYTIVVTNHGPDGATGVVVTDVLDSRLIFINATGNYNFNGTHIVWSVGNLNIANNVTLTLIVRINGTGNITNDASLTVDQDNVGNNSTDGNGTNFTVDATVNLTITKTHNVTTNVIVGDIVAYTITVANSGPDNATGLVIIDILDPRLIFVSASSTNYDATNGRWTINNLAVNQTVTLIINVMVNGTGNISNVAAVSINQENIGDENASSIPLIANHTLTFISVDNITQSATLPFNITGTVTSLNNWAVNGYVNITINGTVYTATVTNGTFRLPLTYYVYGLYNDLTVEYFGDALFAPSNTTGWLDILPVSTTTTVSTSTALIFNYPTNITALLVDQFNRPVIGALVTFIVEGTIIGTGITNGQGIAIHSFTPDLFIANYTIEAIYSGNGTYLSSNDTFITLSRGMDTYIIIAEVTTKSLRNTTISISLYNEFGIPISGEVIRVVIANIEYNLTTNAQGIAYLYHIPQDATPIPIEAKFIGNAFMRGSEQIGILNVEKLTTKIELNNVVLSTVAETTLTAILKDEDGNLLSNADIDFYVDGVYLATFVTDSYGKVYVTGEQIPKGTYTIRAVFAGMANIWAGTSSESTLTIRPIRTSLVVSTIQTPNETTIFTARLFDEFNKPVARKIIVFYLDGVFIGMAETNHNGVATFNHSFIPSGRIIAEFLGDNIYRESIDSQYFGISVLNNFTNTTNTTNTNNTTNSTNSNNNGTNDDSSFKDDIEDIKGAANSKDNSTTVLTMLTTGNPIAILLILLLALFIIGFRPKKKN